ncbi:MAG: hypothetical protein V4722_28265 [Bacteroidota bacterium]
MKQLYSLIKNKRTYTSVLVMALVIMVMTFESCYNRKADIVYPPPVTCDTTNIRYSVEVVNVLKTNCYICHMPGFAPSGVFLNDYNIVKNMVNNNKLINVIQWTPGFSRMPKNQPKLSDCNIAIIRTWIRNGAPNN